MPKMISSIVMPFVVLSATSALAQTDGLLYVVDDLGRPVQGASVALDLEPVDGVPDVTAVTDAFGYARLDPIPNGTYTLEVDHPAFSPEVQTGLVVDGTTSLRRTVSLSGVPAEIFIDLFFDVQCAHTSAKLPGVTITVSRWDTADTGLPGDPDRFLVTDSQGVAVLRGVKPGYFKLNFFTANWDEYDTTDAVYYGQSQVIAAGLQPQYADLVVDVEGFDPRGQTPAVGPLEQVLVEIEGVDLTDSDRVLVPARSVFTSATGSVTFQHLPPIRWKVRTSRFGYVADERIVEPQALGGFLAQDVSLSLRAQQITVALQSLYDDPEPLEGTTIELVGVAGSDAEGVVRTLDADATAQAVFDNLMPGMYHLRIEGHEGQLTALPDRSGTLDPGPTSFTIRFEAREATVFLPVAEQHVETIELDVVPAIVDVEVWGTSELLPANADYPQKSRLFEALPTEGLDFVWHETTRALVDLPTQSVATSADGRASIAIIPGRYGIKLPLLADYSGHDIVYSDPSGEFPSGRQGWPYADLWPYSNFDPTLHSGWVHFSSGVHYALRLDLHHHEMNWRQLVDWDYTADPCHQVTVHFAGGSASNPVTIDWVDMIQNEGLGIISGGFDAEVPLVPFPVPGFVFGEAAFTDLQAGSYWLTASHPRNSFSTVTLNIAEWSSPGEPPTVAPGSSNDYFPGIPWIDGNKRIRATYEGPQLYMELYRYVQVQANPPAYEYEYFDTIPGAQFYEAEYVPAGTLCGPTVVNNRAPVGSYVAYREITPGKWFKVAMSGGGTVQVFYSHVNGVDGPADNVSEDNAPTFAGGYQLTLKAVSVDDETLEIPNVSVTFEDGRSLDSGFSGSHQGSFRVSSASSTSDWTYADEWKWELVGPQVPWIEVVVKMTRGSMISGRVEPEGVPYPNARVIAYRSNGGHLGETLTDASGAFTLGPFPPQTVYVGVEAKGYEPWRERFTPASAASPDIAVGVVDLEAIPLGAPPEVTLDRYGLFLPGVLWSGDDELFDPENAKSNITATWTADVPYTDWEYTVHGFEYTPGVHLDSTHRVMDEAVLVCLVDRRSFAQPGVNLEEGDEGANDPPWHAAPTDWVAGQTQPLRYGAVMAWLEDMQRAVQDGSPANVVYDCATERKEHPLPDGTTDVRWGGRLELWNLPPGELQPMLLVVMQSGAIGIADYTYPLGKRPLKGYRLPAWAQRFLAIIGFASNFPDVSLVSDNIPTGWIVPVPTFSSGIDLTEDKYLTYDYRIGASFTAGQKGSGSGPLAAGPSRLAVAVDTDAKKSKAQTGSLDGISLRLRATGVDNSVSLGGVLGASTDLKSIIGPFKPPLVGNLVPEVSASLKGSASVDVVKRIQGGWEGLGRLPDFQLKLGAKSFFSGSLSFPLDPLISKLAIAIPAVGPIASLALESVFAVADANFVLKAGIGGSYMHTTSTFLPTVGGTTVPTTTGQPLLGHALGGYEAAFEGSSDAYKLALEYGVGLNASVGKSGITGLIQIGRPNNSTQDGVEFTLNSPPYEWPFIKKVRGALSGIITLKANLWVSTIAKDFKFDFLTFEKELGTAPWLHAVPLNVTQVVTGPSNASAAQFNPTGGELISGLYSPGGVSHSATGTHETVAFIDVDESTDEMLVMVSTKSGTSWSSPVEVARAGGVLDVATLSLSSGGALVVWTEIDGADVSNPFPSSLVRYAVSNGSGFGAAATLAALPDTAHSPLLADAGGEVLLVVEATSEGPNADRQRLLSASFDGGAWSALSELAPLRALSNKALAGAGAASAAGHAILAATAPDGALAAWTFGGSSWSAESSLATTASHEVAATFDESGAARVVWVDEEGALHLSSWEVSSGWSDLATELTMRPLRLAVAPAEVAGAPALVVAWTSGAEKTTVRYAYLRLDGSRIGAIGTALDETAGVYTDLQLRSGDSGDPVILVKLDGAGSSSVVEASLPQVSVCVEGTPCDDGLFCTIDDACNAAGECVGELRDCSNSACDPGFCNEVQDACESLPLAVGDYCVVPGQPCSVGTCWANGECVAELDYGCFIEGVCVAADGSNPDNACQVCDPGQSTTSWSANQPGAVCKAAYCDAQGDAVGPSTCDSAGNCAEPAPVDCGTAACVEQSCVEICISDTDCAFPSVCVSGECINGMPVAEAGVDQIVRPETLVTLDGRRSYDPDGNPLTFTWSQISGPVVTLQGDDTSTPTFAAPTITGVRDRVVFLLTVTDGGLAATDVAIVDIDQTSENTPPTAVVTGPSQALPGATITLSAASSTDAEGNSLSAYWSQEAGPAGVLAGPDSMELQLTIPEGASLGEEIRIGLIVNDGAANSSLVSHTLIVADEPDPNDGGDDPPDGGQGPGGTQAKDGGCGCGGADPSLLTLLAAAALIARRRRAGR